MTFRNRLQYLLVKRLQIANKMALSLIQSGVIMVNGLVVNENVIINLEDEVVYNNQLIKEGKKMIYLAFYKPRGIETTLNTNIPENLKEILPFEDALFPVGRLDKESEGLLLLTNDGRLFDKTLRKEHQTEKEYFVTVDKVIDEEFITRMSNGIQIMGKMTLPCKVEKITDFSFKIILVQGLNRQIRRMCYQLHYEVLELIRTRIGNVLLENLTPSTYRHLSMTEIQQEV
ncbi:MULTISPECIES: pseudouridine synthase [unclassified Arcicella]|uniref:pseudouridine synthase n=1 Tax=unclassified Arcicella TaxID=2644986 RepID=UPI002863C1F1|nr:MULTISPECIES: pseudouridine synthase [unclassified Arcicella]MDR6563036.1 23S rRNA pseudouridine2604 synthase [Arcicella sp. BE51]MDR6813120.1 23S rRNA pseudouridine2604 synthase [Arcicella sp. BE140]MDR6824434.1 23S rRNA pseudouridine2604 synthase [Arcicella sp. BE139]